MLNVIGKVSLREQREVRTFREEEGGKTLRKEGNVVSVFFVGMIFDYMESRFHREPIPFKGSSGNVY